MSKIIRIYITENCNSKCRNCFNAGDRGNATIDCARFLELCDYFKSNGIRCIKIMGGEPTIHPQFLEIMTIAQDYFPEVFLFTNAINDEILKFSPRDSDAIIYNFRFSKFLTEEKLLLSKPGRRSLEIQITKSTNIEKIYNEILSKCAKFSTRINPCFTFDCTENIFEGREELVSKYEAIWNLCQEVKFNIGQDHLVPLCFLYGSKIKIPKTGCMCEEQCEGLIDASFNIKFCNQFSAILGNLYDGQTLIPFDKYLALLSKERINIQTRVREKICGRCPFYLVYCNGGCFIAKDFIDTTTILRNSPLAHILKVP